MGYRVEHNIDDRMGLIPLLRDCIIRKIRVKYTLVRFIEMGFTEDR